MYKSYVDEKVIFIVVAFIVEMIFLSLLVGFSGNWPQKAEEKGAQL